MRRIALFAPFAALLVLAGVSAAGSYIPPAGDCCPQWSPHGTQIVFTTERATGIQRTPTVGFVAPTGGAEHFVLGIPVGARSPDWTYVAYTKDQGGATWLAVSKVDGTGEKLLAKVGANADFTWASDSKRLAFVATSGALQVIGADGSGQATVGPAPAAMPAWSPDGARIAYVGGQHIHVVKADGTGNQDVTPGETGALEPAWSPNGKQVSYLAGSSIVVRRLGGASRSYQLGRPALLNNGWFPDGKALLIVVEPVLPADVPSAGTGTMVGGRLFENQLVRVDIGTGARRALSFGEFATFSPDHRSVAFSSGGDCRDRTGVYVMKVNGTKRRRLSNDCRILGTAGNDSLHGTEQADVLVGLAGNDRLRAVDTGYVGDTLNGGAGNDTLLGAIQSDTLFGGPGNDTLNGGPSADWLDGGPGRDHLNGGGGRDVIEARDGQRDVITCGGNAFGPRGKDTVFADRVDSVASDCEIVHRS